MILRLKPIFFEKIWGGTKISELYNEKSDKIGECWGISALAAHSNVIESQMEFKGLTLRNLYKDRRDLFGNYPSDEFPILVKYIDAKENLSIQVHPGDLFAKDNENALGKEECWYILDSKIDTKIVIGHTASSKKKLNDYIKNKRIQEIVKEYNVKTGDYFFIPSGTVHAICKNTFLLEVSQSSDITYRIFDYNRVHNGIERELHIDKALEVMNVPDNILHKEHISRKFTFDIVHNIGETMRKADKFGDYISVLDGEGFIDNFRVKAGDFFMVSSASNYKIEGALKYHLSQLI